MNLFRSAMVVCLAVTAQTAAACDRDPIPQEDRLLESDGKFDPVLISRLILEDVNVHRCKEGLPALSDDRRLINVSVDHSDWMAAAGILSHDSNLEGRRNLKEKLVYSAFRYRSGAENVAYVSFYNFKGAPFYKGEGTCDFTNADTGEGVARHTYASVSAGLVTNWMDSPGHRKNIMLPDVDHAGAGIALDGSAEHCGRIYATHIFAQEK